MKGSGVPMHMTLKQINQQKNNKVDIKKTKIQRHKGKKHFVNCYKNLFNRKMNFYKENSIYQTRNKKIEGEVNKNVSKM